VRNKLGLVHLFQTNHFFNWWHQKPNNQRKAVDATIPVITKTYGVKPIMNACLKWLTKVFPNFKKINID
jgi:hypothetical protein